MERDRNDTPKDTDKNKGKTGLNITFCTFIKQRWKGGVKKHLGLFELAHTAVAIGLEFVRLAVSTPVPSNPSLAILGSCVPRWSSHWLVWLSSQVDDFGLSSQVDDFWLSSQVDNFWLSSQVDDFACHVDDDEVRKRQTTSNRMRWYRKRCRWISRGRGRSRGIRVAPSLLHRCPHRQRGPSGDWDPPLIREHGVVGGSDGGGDGLHSGGDGHSSESELSRMDLCPQVKTRPVYIINFDKFECHLPHTLPLILFENYISLII